MHSTIISATILLVLLCCSALSPVVSATGSRDQFETFASLLNATTADPPATAPPYRVVDDAIVYDNLSDVNRLYRLTNGKLKYEKSASPKLMAELYTLMNQSLPKKDDKPANLSFLNLNLTMFHRYGDIRVGKWMSLWFTNQAPKSAALLRDPHPQLISPYATNRKVCGEREPWEERRFCAESLADMTDFVTRTLSTDDVRPISTPGGKWQRYKVVGEAMTIAHQLVGCHKQIYLPYAVYGCHYIPQSRARIVPLLGEDGTRLNAVSVCHMDTSSWNGHHLLFLLLKAKPGPPVCHFLATDDIIWIPRA